MNAISRIHEQCYAGGGREYRPSVLHDVDGEPLRVQLGTYPRHSEARAAIIRYMQQNGLEEHPGSVEYDSKGECLVGRF